MADRRDIVVKVRFSAQEVARLDKLLVGEPFQNRAEFLRGRGLAACNDRSDLAVIIGRLGLAINALEPGKSSKLNELLRELRILTLAVAIAKD